MEDYRIKKQNILVTGGAGFIGSNLVESLLLDDRVAKVRVLDNLSNGFKKNIVPFLKNPDFEFIEGDIRNFETCLEVMKDIDLVSHQAALGSVPRSIKDPLTTNHVNIGGTLNIFHAVKETNVKRIVFAASSSTYGDSNTLPKEENVIGSPLSPYAITKLVNELYAEVYKNTFDSFEYIGLRYFNVFGPNQDPNGAYAAVIPLFFKAALCNNSPIINGDGSFSRDFTYISNAIKANTLAMFSQNKESVNQVYNVACGERTNLNELWDIIKEITDSKSEVVYGPNRSGDIPHSLADISKIKNLLNYSVIDNPKSGLFKASNYYSNIYSKT